LGYWEGDRIRFIVSIPFSKTKALYLVLDVCPSAGHEDFADLGQIDFEVFERQ
jgi:hypothetical protein